MDWLFNALEDFFVWTFGGLEALGMGFNWFMIFAVAGLTLWWMVKMFFHPKEKQ